MILVQFRKLWILQDKHGSLQGMQDYSDDSVVPIIYQRDQIFEMKLAGLAIS